jgi:hypothetical protein
MSAWGCRAEGAGWISGIRPAIRDPVIIDPWTVDARSRSGPWSGWGYRK